MSQTSQCASSFLVGNIMSNSQYYERVDDQKAQDLSKEIGTYPNVVHLLIVDVLTDEDVDGWSKEDEHDA